VWFWKKWRKSWQNHRLTLRRHTQTRYGLDSL